MRSLKSLTMAAFALLTFLLVAPATQAHAQLPAYLHALSDLRSARAYLQYDTRPAWAGHREHALSLIHISRLVSPLMTSACSLRNWV